MTRKETHQQINTIFNKIDVNNGVRLSSIDVNKSRFLIKEETGKLYIQTYNHGKTTISKPSRNTGFVRKIKRPIIKTFKSFTTRRKVMNLTTKKMNELLQTLEWIKQNQG